MKANVNGKCTCWSLQVRPVASFNCLVSNSRRNLQCMKVAVTVFWTKAMGSLSLSVLQLKEVFNSGCKCPRMYDAWVLRWSSLQLRRILAVETGGSPVVTACTTRGLCFSVLQLKANFNSESKRKTCSECRSAVTLSSSSVRKRLQRYENGDCFFHGSSDPAPAALPKVRSS